jgi:hypothetical protein
MLIDVGYSYIEDVTRVMVGSIEIDTDDFESMDEVEEFIKDNMYDNSECDSEDCENTRNFEIDSNNFSEVEEALEDKEDPDEINGLPKDFVLGKPVETVSNPTLTPNQQQSA